MALYRIRPKRAESQKPRIVLEAISSMDMDIHIEKLKSLSVSGGNTMFRNLHRITMVVVVFGRTSLYQPARKLRAWKLFLDYFIMAGEEDFKWYAPTGLRTLRFENPFFLVFFCFMANL